MVDSRSGAPAARRMDAANEAPAADALSGTGSPVRERGARDAGVRSCNAGVVGGARGLYKPDVVAVLIG